MKCVSGFAVNLPAENYGSPLRAKGYVDGRLWRERDLPPTKTNMTGIDDYACGFRAGYFAIPRTRTRSPHC